MKKTKELNKMRIGTHDCTQKEKGITLIALVITIIVMLILVGVTISMAVNGGLFNYAGKATGETKNKLEAEQQLANGGIKVGDTWYNSIDEYLEGSGITMLEGDGQTYYTLAPTALSFRSSADINDFQEVQVNGETIDPSNYTITEGSTIINLSIDYLKTLEEDDYSISIVSKTGSPSAGFSIVEPDVNNHGFYYNQPYTAYVDAYGCNYAFFIRENGTYDFIGYGGSIDTPETMTSTYEVSGNNIIAGDSHGTVSADGMSIYIAELDITFRLGEESIVADEEYIYIYNESLGGYEVVAIDKTKAEYAPIKTGINGFSTVALAKNAFSAIMNGNENLVKIPEFPNTLATIGMNAFDDCTSLTNVVVPDSVKTIGSGAFWYCTGLKSIYIPNSVTNIGANFVYGCSSLTELIIPDSVTTPVDHVFGGCKNLVNVITGDGVTGTIQLDFADSTALTNITIGKNITGIANQAFRNNVNLTNVIFAKDSKLSTIGESAFNHCENLSSITIPKNVTSIGEFAFNSCVALKDITFEGTMEQWKAITFGHSWYAGPATEVVCSDGTVAL